MRLVTISRTAPVIVGAIAAVSLLVSVLPAANAQGWQNGDNNSGGFHQRQPWHGDGDGNGGGYDQGHSWRHHHSSEDSNSFSGQYYGGHEAYYHHHYRGSEHRRYYSYGGNEFYINLDTGVRIAL